MMNVPIKDQNTPHTKLFNRRLGRNCDVVEDTKPHGMMRFSMMA
jgi:hypothetical protein